MSGEAKRDARDLGLLALRVATGAVFIVYGWPKFANPTSTIAFWHRLHLPLASIMGPVQGTVEFVGGILILLGLLTRVCGALLALDMVGALLLVRIPHAAFRGGWALEWEAFWIACALLCTGAGAYSLDHLLLRRQRTAATG